MRLNKINVCLRMQKKTKQNCNRVVQRTNPGLNTAAVGNLDCEFQIGTRGCRTLDVFNRAILTNYGINSRLVKSHPRFSLIKGFNLDG